VVLLPGVEIRGAERLAETLRRRVAQQAIRHDARELCITISVGCAQVERHESLDQLIARADKALYRAKDLGRNRIAVG
jgi:diguanylate cyclase (GGDEF)-like protein